MLGLHAVGVFPELLLLKAHLGSFCVAERKLGVSMNIPEFKVVISFWCCDAKLMEIREPDVIWSHRYLKFYMQLRGLFIKGTWE